MIICSICENGPVAGRLPAKHKLKHFRMRRKQCRCRFNCPSGVPGAKMAAFPSSWPPVAAGRAGDRGLPRPSSGPGHPPPPTPLGAPWATLQPPQGSGSETGHAQLGQCRRAPRALAGATQVTALSRCLAWAPVLEFLTARGSPTRGPWALRAPPPGFPPRGLPHPGLPPKVEGEPGERAWRAPTFPVSSPRC